MLHGAWAVAWLSSSALVSVNVVTTTDPVNTWMGDRLWG